MTRRSRSDSLNRRTFLGATTAAGLSRLAAADEVFLARLQGHIHPDVYIVRKNLADSVNALPNFSKAANSITSLHEFASQYFSKLKIESPEVFTKTISLVREAEDGWKQFPKGPARACVDQWLKENASADRLIDVALAKPSLRIPTSRLIENEADAFEQLTPVRETQRLKSVQFFRLLADNDLPQAMSVASAILRHPQLALDADGFLIHFLVALAIHNSALECVEQAFRHPKITDAQLDTLATHVANCRPTTEMLANAYRVESIYFNYRLINKLPAWDKLDALVEAIVDQHLLGEIDADQVDRRHAEFVRRGMLQIFDGHPQPFSPEKTIELHSRHVAMLINDVASPWKTRKHDLGTQLIGELSDWPQSLWFLSDISLLVYGIGTEDEPILPRQMRSIRDKLASVDNPIGKLMLLSLNAFDGIRQAFHRSQLVSDGTLLALGCYRFRLQHARWPRALGEILDARIVDRLPTDPFTDVSLQYDARTRLIWSDGPSARQQLDPGELPDRIVWRLES